VPMPPRKATSMGQSEQLVGSFSNSPYLRSSRRVLFNDAGFSLFWHGVERKGPLKGREEMDEVTFGCS